MSQFINYNKKMFDRFAKFIILINFIRNYQVIQDYIMNKNFIYSFYEKKNYTYNDNAIKFNPLKLQIDQDIIW